MDNQIKSEVCPNCGYCPHCKRGGGYITYPVYPSYPTDPWTGPYWCYQGTNTGDYFPPNITFTCGTESNG